jgi:hypothetical protein
MVAVLHQDAKISLLKLEDGGLGRVEIKGQAFRCAYPTCL